MIEGLYTALTQMERRAVRALLDIPPDVISDKDSQFERKGEVLRCAIVSEDRHRCCPFEMIFHRDGGVTRFSLFLGKGAQFHDSEVLSNDEIDDIANDLRVFLRSTIEVERHLRGSDTVRELYSLTCFRSVGNVPIKFTYRSRYPWPIIRFQKELDSYEPWIK